MQVFKLPISEIQSLPPLLQAYIAQRTDVKDFFPEPLSAEGILHTLKQRQLFPVDRAALVQSLQAQYRKMNEVFFEQEVNREVVKSIRLLQHENTFTVTTGHQLQIFTGPLFFIYKIVSTISYAKWLAQQFPDFQFVPIYWMATEDHDFEEINHFYIGNKKLEWQHEDAGKAVGRLSTKGLEKLVEQVRRLTISYPKGEELIKLFKDSYTQQTNLSLATRKLVHELFKDEGLVILDADDANLKRNFSHILREEFLHQPVEKLVNETVSSLEDFKPPVAPRNINLFYLGEKIRSRIVKQEETYFLADNEAENWTQEELLNELENHPERFSPNVLMRPLYQETILPNLSYIGGPNELAYWLQLKSTFAHFNVFYPQLLLRDSALFLNRKHYALLRESNIQLPAIFKSYADLKAHYYEQNSLYHPSEKTADEMLQQYQMLREQIQDLGAETAAFIVRDCNEYVKSLKKWKSAMRKRLETSQKAHLQKLEQLKSDLFPNGTPQERIQNFTEFSMLLGEDFLKVLKENFDPLALEMKVFVMDDL